MKGDYFYSEGCCKAQHQWLCFFVYLFYKELVRNRVAQSENI